jgi:hypothetical protein
LLFEAIVNQIEFIEPQTSRPARRQMSKRPH